MPDPGGSLQLHVPLVEQNQIEENAMRDSSFNTAPTIWRELQNGASQPSKCRQLVRDVACQQPSPAMLPTADQSVTRYKHSPLDPTTLKLTNSATLEHLHLPPPISCATTIVFSFNNALVRSSCRPVTCQNNTNHSR